MYHLQGTLENGLDCLQEPAVPLQLEYHRRSGFACVVLCTDMDLVISVGVKIFHAAMVFALSSSRRIFENKYWNTFLATQCQHTRQLWKALLSPVSRNLLPSSSAGQCFSLAVKKRVVWRRGMGCHWQCIVHSLLVCFHVIQITFPLQLRGVDSLFPPYWRRVQNMQQ